MGLTPLLHSLGVFAAAEVIPIGPLAQPAVLAGALAGRAAGGFGTVKLVMPVSIIRKKQLLATTAFATAEFGTHACVPTGEEKPAARATTLGQKKRKNEEGRKVLSQDCEENTDGRKRNFKPP